MANGGQFLSAFGQVQNGKENPIAQATLPITCYKFCWHEVEAFKQRWFECKFMS